MKFCAPYHYLAEHVRHSPTLDDTAQAFGVSAATPKRHIPRHGSHFRMPLMLRRSVLGAA